MKLKTNEKIPDTNFFYFDSGPKKINSDMIFKNEKVVLVAVPGAFTPTCNEEHIPSFVKNSNLILKKGWNKIVVVSVNDPFVTHAWSKSFDCKNVVFFADPFAEFAKKIGYTIDLSVIGLGVRFSRFAMLVNNKLVTHIFDEDGGELNKSSADEVLKVI